MKINKEKIDVHSAVFNQHINKAGLRALKVIKHHFPSMYEEIRKADKKGIMSIFNQEPTETSLVYSALVTAFVNEY